MPWQKPKLVLLLSATAGITVTLAYVVYLLTQQKDEDYEEDEPKLTVKTSRNVTIEVKIPKESIGLVIGRGGATIKSIQQKSGTRINFKNEDETEESATCIIRGTAETAQLAESMILEIIKNQPLVNSDELMVPVSAIGWIIGKAGENIKAMSSISHAKISVATAANYDSSPERKVTIQGTYEQIEMAKSLILEKVAADAEQKQKIALSAASRSPRNKPNHLELKNTAANIEQPRTSHFEKLVSTNSDGFMSVYVATVQDPSCFWVQTISRKSVDLDKLVEEMTEFYNIPTNRSSLAVNPESLKIGLKVASQFHVDHKWYRGEVQQIIEDEYNPDNSKVLIFYVDYGNTEELKISDLCLLQADFLRLTFQAIECSLDNIKPKDSETWSEEAIVCFETLTYVGLWKNLMARVNSYKDPDEQSSSSMPIPCVDLVDTHHEEDLLIAQELVDRGFAVRIKPDPRDFSVPNSHLPNNNDIKSNKSKSKSEFKKAPVNVVPAGYEDELSQDSDLDDFDVQF